MIEVADTSPAVDVHPAEYLRLLGYPRGRELEGRALELATWARQWYARHGRPWVYARQAVRVELNHNTVGIDGETFASPRLRATLTRAGAHAAVLVAVSAGRELEAHAQSLWRQEKPDEYFFLEVFGSAVVEHLVTMTGARLCAWAESHAMAVLPHDSPGYPEWDVAQQPRLLSLLKHGGRQPLPGDLETLETGMLRPKKSLLAVFGVTRHTDRARRLTDLIPCEGCAFDGCQYRRAPYAGAAQWSEVETVSRTLTRPATTAPPAPYTVNVKALRRWADERLTLTPRGDGLLDAHFRYEGTTCSNMGRALRFDYRVTLGPPDTGYRVLHQSCSPSPDDTGHPFMCRYLNDGERLMLSLRDEKPLAGRPLRDVLGWDAPASSAGCFCEQRDRLHKWRQVFETIHYALNQPKRGSAMDATWKEQPA